MALAPPVLSAISETSVISVISSDLVPRLVPEGHRVEGPGGSARPAGRFGGPA
jgi:hypothetical protein